MYVSDSFIENNSLVTVHRTLTRTTHSEDDELARHHALLKQGKCGMKQRSKMTTDRAIIALIVVYGYNGTDINTSGKFDNGCLIPSPRR